MNPTVIDAWFNALDAELSARNGGDGLPASNGEIRHDVRAEEFMLMDASTDLAAFKHRWSRNYVYLQQLLSGDSRLDIPADPGKPWHGGTFDRCPV